MLRRLLLAIVAVTVATLALLVALPAAAAPAGWAAFEPRPAVPSVIPTTLTQKAVGFPHAAITTDSAGNSGAQTGTSTFLGAGTAVGAKYGSSRGQQYLNLRPSRSNSNPPSTTTYAFERATPSSGWTFVLGDVDADQVTITATAADDAPVDPADLGFRGVFNYCAPGLTPKPSACPAGEGTSLPVWVEADGLLKGNEAALDTAGASAWFEPTVALSSLTLTYAQRSGAPIYQTWFSALQFDIAGTVTVTGGSAEGQTVRLYDPEGNLVGRTTTRADGTYTFPSRATYDDYRVELVRPDGFTSDNALSQRIDLSTGDRTDVDFSLRQIVPVPVSGSVTVVGGDPAPGVTLTLTGPGDVNRTVTTDGAGNYLLDDVGVGEGYQIIISPPDGFTADDPELTFNVPPNSESAIGGQNFVLTAEPTGSVAGTVTDGDGPRSGVVVTVIGPDGFERVLRTAGDGTYTLDGLPPGEYTVTVIAPTGSTIVGATTVSTTITDAGEDRAALDFAFAVAPVPATYEARGMVTDTPDEAPVAGVEVTLTLPDGETIITTTDETGMYAISGLEDARDYSIAVTPPGDYGVVEAPEAFDVDGDDVGGLDFVLELQYDISATVTDPDGDSVPGATVVLSDDQNALPLTTDESGTVTFTEVPAGEYTATIEPPDGYFVPDGKDDIQDVTVSDDDVQLSFVLEAEVVIPSPSPSASSTASTSPPAPTEESVSVANGGGSLADTGGPSRVILFVGLGLLVVGGGVTLAGRLIARRRTGAHRG